MNLQHFNNRLCSEGQWSKRSYNSACLLQLVKHTSGGEDCCGRTEFILHERNIGPYLKILMKTCFPPKTKEITFEDLDFNSIFRICFYFVFTLWLVNSILYGFAG